MDFRTIKVISLLLSMCLFSAVEVFCQDDYDVHAALTDERISSVIIEGGLVSWYRMVTDPIHRRQFDNILPGVLADYDLPVLAAGLAPRPLDVYHLASAEWPVPSYQLPVTFAKRAVSLVSSVSFVSRHCRSGV
jgi:hypothetical protein